MATLKWSVTFTLGALSLIGGYTVWVLGQGEKPVAEVAAHLEQHVADEGQSRRQLRADIHETQADIRALYKTVVTGRPQERLEQMPDGGRP